MRDIWPVTEYNTQSVTDERGLPYKVNDDINWNAKKRFVTIAQDKIPR